MPTLLPLVNEEFHDNLRGVVMLDAALVVNATTMLANCHEVIIHYAGCEHAQTFLHDTAHIVKQLRAVLFGQMIPFPIGVNEECEHE